MNKIHPATQALATCTSIHIYIQTAFQKLLFCSQGGSKYVYIYTHVILVTT